MIHLFEQGGEEWKAYKRGKVSASRIIDIMPGYKGEYRASRANYMAELICEILTGNSTEHFTSAAMEHGTEYEPMARAAYEAITGSMVNQVGFIDHEEIADSGYSPDGLVDDRGLIEIKCPNTATHLDTLINGTVKKDYIYQMNFGMDCSKRAWCDFISYDPRLPDNLSIFIKRFDRDESMITAIREEVKKFQAELQETLEKLREIK